MKINKPNKRQVKVTLYVACAVALITLGAVGTLKVQDGIHQIELRGVRKYQAEKCERIHDKNNKTSWLECEG